MVNEMIYGTAMRPGDREFVLERRIDVDGDLAAGFIEVARGRGDFVIDVRLRHAIGVSPEGMVELSFERDCARAAMPWLLDWHGDAGSYLTCDAPRWGWIRTLLGIEDMPRYVEMTFHGFTAVEPALGAAERLRDALQTSLEEWTDLIMEDWRADSDADNFLEDDWDDWGEDAA